VGEGFGGEEASFVVDQTRGTRKFCCFSFGVMGWGGVRRVPAGEAFTFWGELGTLADGRVSDEKRFLTGVALISLTGRVPVVALVGGLPWAAGFGGCRGL
jgi:hypothetical protein